MIPAFPDLNEGFLLYEAQEIGLGDDCAFSLRADIESLRIAAGTYRVAGPIIEIADRFRLA